VREASGLKLRLREKGGKVRLLHCNSQVLSPSLLELIERLPFSSGYIFRGYQKGYGWTEKKLGRQNCYAMVKKQTKRLEFDKRLSNHSFRCSFATAWLDKNYSIDSLKKIGGWANLDTVKRYDRNSQEASISELELLKI
jgi:integrase